MPISQLKIKHNFTITQSLFIIIALNIIKQHGEKSFTYKIFVNIIFFIFQILLKRACYSSIMDIPPVPNQPTSFIFPQRSFGKANPVKSSFQASWFSTRTWLYHNETYKISSASRAKIVSKCIKIV